MKFGLFYEHQLPQPWAEDSELRLYQQALDQVELADRLGIDYVWQVEHHFLEEYSHAGAPEVFLAACSQRTSRIRLGHGIVQIPPGVNHPARVAERIAMLDLVSNGRVEFGTRRCGRRARGPSRSPSQRATAWARCASRCSSSPKRRTSGLTPTTRCSLRRSASPPGSRSTPSSRSCSP